MIDREEGPYADTDLYVFGELCKQCKEEFYLTDDLDQVLCDECLADDIASESAADLEREEQDREPFFPPSLITARCKEPKPWK